MCRLFPLAACQPTLSGGAQDGVLRHASCARPLPRRRQHGRPGSDERGLRQTQSPPHSPGAVAAPRKESLSQRSRADASTAPAVCPSARAGSQTGLNYDLLLRFIEVQALVMAPITPHVSEYIWTDLLHKVRAGDLASFGCRPLVRLAVLNIPAWEGPSSRSALRGVRMAGEGWPPANADHSDAVAGGAGRGCVHAGGRDLRRRPGSRRAPPEAGNTTAASLHARARQERLTPAVGAVRLPGDRAHRTL